MQQTQNANLAKRLGGLISAANEEFKDKPPDIRGQRLPPGIRDGIAKLSAVYTKTQDNDDGVCPKGDIFFRASATVASPEYHEGERVANMVTSQTVPLCNVPERTDNQGKKIRDAIPLNTNWNKFRSLMEALGVPKCPETKQSDPDGSKTWAYFDAMMQAMCRPGAPPIYVSFSTRGWTPPGSKDEIVFETWHGLADKEAVAALSEFNPATAGIRDGSPPSTPPPAAPPSANGPTRQEIKNEQYAQQYGGTTQAQSPAPPVQPVQPVQPAQPTAPPTAPVYADPEEVAALVEMAMGDPDSPESVDASNRLEELAWAAGATEEQTTNAADWAAVGAMCLPPEKTIPPAVTPTPSAPTTPTVGSRWLFARRARDGSKLKDSKGQEFPASEVTVVTTDANARTCTVKTTKDGKDVIDFRSKQPIVIKWDWLEAIPY